MRKGQITAEPLEVWAQRYRGPAPSVISPHKAGRVPALGCRTAWTSQRAHVQASWARLLSGVSGVLGIFTVWECGITCVIFGTSGSSDRTRSSSRRDSPQNGAFEDPFTLPPLYWGAKISKQGFNPSEKRLIRKQP